MAKTIFLISTSFLISNPDHTGLHSLTTEALILDGGKGNFRYPKRIESAHDTKAKWLLAPVSTMLTVRLFLVGNSDLFGN
jgi:hypothetical protein